MSASEEAAVCRQGAWVGTLEDVVARGVYQFGLAPCRCSPKQEDESFPIPRQGFYDGIGEGFPPSARMAERLVGTDAEAGVEQEHSLPCPTGEVATLWYGSARFRLYLLKDVPERWRKWYAVLNGEAKSVCLPVAMVGVLPQNDHLNVVERCLVEGIEDEPCRRKALHGAVLLADEVGQLPEVWLLKLGGEPGFPTLLHADVFHNRKTEIGKRKTASKREQSNLFELPSGSRFKNAKRD